MAESETLFSRSSSSRSLRRGGGASSRRSSRRAPAPSCGDRRPRAAAPLPFGDARLRRALAVRAGIGRLEVDDVAQEHAAFDQLVAPDDDGLEGQRALAQAGDHRLAAGLDALGDGDLALAREKLDRAHLAQVHAHRIVGAVGRLLGRGLAHRRRRGPAPSRRGRRLRPPPRRPASPAAPGRPSSASSDSTTLMPISESWPSTSSICSEVNSSEGSTSFSSS